MRDQVLNPHKTTHKIIIYKYTLISKFFMYIQIRTVGPIL